MLLFIAYLTTVIHCRLFRNQKLLLLFCPDESKLHSQTHYLGKKELAHHPCAAPYRGFLLDFEIVMLTFKAQIISKWLTWYAPLWPQRSADITMLTLPRRCFVQKGLFRKNKKKSSLLEQKELFPLLTVIWLHVCIHE